MIVMSDSKVDLRGEKLHEEFWRGRQWSVTDYGIEKRDGTYYIEKSRYLEQIPNHSWIAHMAGKTWLDLDDFATAFFVALSVHRVSASAEQLDALRADLEQARERIAKRKIPTLEPDDWFEPRR